MTQQNQPTPEKRVKTLSKKDLLFVDKVVEDGNVSKAVRETYNVQDPKYAYVKGQRLIENDVISNAIEVKRKSLKQALIDQGITENYLAEKVGVLLTATDEKGKEDYTAIDKGLKHATSIYGVIDPQKTEGGNTYNFLFNAEAQSDIKELEDKIKAKLLQKYVEES